MSGGGTNVSGSGRRGWGCLSLLGAVLLACALLVINGAIVVAAYSSFVSPETALLGNPHVIQLVFFLAPMVLLAMQWVVIDIIADRTVRRRRRT